MSQGLRVLVLAKQRLQWAAFNAGLAFEQTGGQPSVRKLAAANGVSRGTAERWLADKHFQRLFDDGRRFAASTKTSKNGKKLSRTAHKKRAGARAGVPSKNN